MDIVAADTVIALRARRAGAESTRQPGMRPGLESPIRKEPHK
jgi:hypothetical protein